MLFHQNMSKIDWVEAEILQYPWEVSKRINEQGNPWLTRTNLVQTTIDAIQMKRNNSSSLVILKIKDENLRSSHWCLIWTLHIYPLNDIKSHNQIPWTQNQLSATQRSIISSYLFPEYINQKLITCKKG